MKTIYKTIQVLVFVAVINTTGLFAQCLGGSNYGWATNNGVMSSYNQIAWCMFFSERNVLTVNFITGSYSFSVTGASYITIYDASNNVVAQGNSPLANVNFTATGTYYLRPSNAGPPACTGGSGCIDSFWKCEVPCSGQPSTGTITATPTLVCPGASAGIILPGSSIGTGLQYQWYESPNSIGPWTAISGANSDNYSTPSSQSSTVYYLAVMTCTWSNLTTTSTPVQIDVASTTTNSVPYYESFEGISYDGMMPNCSWLASNPGVTETFTTTYWGNRSARTGTKYASFYSYYVSGANYFYSNGIEMHPGITYSASVWYKTEFNGYTNVSDISLMVGNSQTPTGLTTIDSNSPATSGLYKPLSGVFTVPASGLYYLAMRATGAGMYGTDWLTWDDLEVTIPCSVNAPTMNVATASQTVCSGDIVNLTASGADSYIWYNGSTGAALSEVANITGFVNYYVEGTHALTGCTSTLNTQILVNTSPVVFVYSSNPISCAGAPVNLTAGGTADSYTWTVGATTQNGPMITVTPSVTTVYNLDAANTNNGCDVSTSIQVSVTPNPTITVNSDVPGNKICKGESINLTASGAASYQWASSSVGILSPVANVSPQSTTVYTVTGTNANDCAGKTTFTVTVDNCTGLNSIATTLSGVKVYPNPTSGAFTVELNSTAKKTIEVTDLTGRVIMTTTSNDTKVNVNINTLANGIYYVKIQSEKAVEVIKLVKD